MKQLLLIWAVAISIIGIGLFGGLASEAQKLNTAAPNTLQETTKTTQENEQKSSEAPATHAPQLSVENLSINEKQVHFAGVNFAYDISLFSDVKAEIVPAHPLDRTNTKPGGYHPEHIRFCFPNEEPDIQPPHV
jgi:hypothetical protein